MISIEHTQTYCWPAAIRGARNPMNSWHLSDSFQSVDYENVMGGYVVGPKDLDLMKRLSNAGPDHGKFLRMITVTMDVSAPLYWWKEFDTYKVGTTANSCSTMHKIHAKEFSVDDFSCEHLFDTDTSEPCTHVYMFRQNLQNTIDALNMARLKYLNTKDKKFWWQMIQNLPTTYNQKRTIHLNYAVLKNMYHARKAHKLDEWHTFCDWISELPFARELIIGEVSE